MSIKSIHISNFQSHKDSSLTLSPGVNLVTGSSDSGKSSIIRALKWLATNRPLGDGFVSWDGKGETEVKVVLDDGTFISHQPGKYFQHHPKDKEVAEWSAIGTGVPETIAQKLNISELSWAHQMDPPFLLSASSGEVARTLNEVADLDKIDTALVNINRMARDNRTALTASAQQKQQLEIELSVYRGLDDQLARVALLKEQERKADALDELVENWEHVQIDLSYAQTRLAKANPIAAAGDELAVLMSMERKAEGLESLVEKGESVRNEVTHLRVRLERVRDTADSEAMLDGLLDMVGQLKGAEGDIDKMGDQLVTIVDAKMALQTVTGNLKRLEIKWHEQFPSVCPLCGRGD